MFTIKAADGHLVQTEAVLHGSDVLVIMSHGITTGKEEDGIYTEFAENVLSPFCDSVRFDFRGHGQSAMPPNQVTVMGEILDFMAVLKWARESGHRKILHLATSFGASVTLLAASRFSLTDLGAVVFWNPVISYLNTFLEPKVEWAREFFNQKKMDELAHREGTRVTETDFVIGPQMTLEFLFLSPENVKWPTDVPLLIIHGGADTAVPSSDAEEYARKNMQSVKLHIVPGVDHGFGNEIRKVFELSLEWFKAHSK